MTIDMLLDYNIKYTSMIVFSSSFSSDNCGSLFKLFSMIFTNFQNFFSIINFYKKIFRNEINILTFFIVDILNKRYGIIKFTAKEAGRLFNGLTFPVSYTGKTIKISNAVK